MGNAFSDGANPSVEAMLRFRCEDVCFLLGFTACRYMTMPITSPGSMENNNALVTHRKQVAELEGRSRFVCTAGGVHTSS
jgi:hypothetical protein